MTTRTSANTQCRLSIPTTHTADSTPSLLVTFDQHKYLFNVPESLSRVCVQSKIGLKKVGKVFVGDLADTVGGLPGFLLSTVESGNHSVEVIAAEGVDHLIASYRFYTRREQLSLTTTPVVFASPSGFSSLPEPVHADANLIVYAFPLSSGFATLPERTSCKRARPSRSPSPFRSKSPPQADNVASTSSFPTPPAQYVEPPDLVGSAADDWRTLVINDMFRGGKKIARVPYVPGMKVDQSPAYLMAGLPHLPPSIKTNISYLGVGPPLRGEFSAIAAKEQGVRPGPKFSALVRGERVWVSHQAYVTPAAVPGAPKPSKAQVKAAIEVKRQWEEAIVDGEGEGHWVESEDCVGPTTDGRAFFVLNLSSPEFLDSLTSLSSTVFTQIENAHLRIIFYFLGPGVLRDPRLAAWIATLPSDIEHRISSSDLEDVNNSIIFAPTTLLILRLRELSETIFSLPKYSFLPPFEDSLAYEQSLLPPTFMPGTRILRPNDSMSLMDTAARESVRKVKTKENIAPPLAAGTVLGAEIRNFDFLVPSPEATIAASRLKSLEKSTETQAKAIAAWDGYIVASALVKAVVAKEETQVAQTASPFEVGDDLVVTPLGTGSAVPSKYRNVSSTLLHLPEGGYFLLDAGEGTWGQLARKFGSGSEGCDKILRGLKCIFISHIHQDHHAGLTTILRKRNQLDPRPEHPLIIISPQPARLYLSEQQELSDLGLGDEHQGSKHQITFLDNNSLERSDYLRQGFFATKYADLLESIGLESIQTVPVLHRCRCWGIVIDHKSGWRVVFSGDTMPCDALVVAGRGATLLIHEATIESDKPDVARAKGHSTFAQAIDIARRMEAKVCPHAFLSAIS